MFILLNRVRQWEVVGRCGVIARNDPPSCNESLYPGSPWKESLHGRHCLHVCQKSPVMSSVSCVKTMIQGLESMRLNLWDFGVATLPRLQERIEVLSALPKGISPSCINTMKSNLPHFHEQGGWIPVPLTHYLLNSLCLPKLKQLMAFHRYW